MGNASGRSGAIFALKVAVDGVVEVGRWMVLAVFVSRCSMKQMGSCTESVDECGVDSNSGEWGFEKM